MCLHPGLWCIAVDWGTRVGAVSDALSLITTLVLFQQVSVWHRQDGHLQYFSAAVLGYPGDLPCVQEQTLHGVWLSTLIPADGALSFIAGSRPAKGT